MKWIYELQFMELKNDNKSKIGDGIEKFKKKQKKECLEFINVLSFL